MKSSGLAKNNGVAIPVLSLFSGAGGLDNGFFMNHKFDVSFALDQNYAAGCTYSMNHGFNIARIENEKALMQRTFALVDIKNVNMRQLNFFHPSIVIGGPPCQDFSMIRGPDSERRGIDEARGRLYAYFVKALINLNPHFFVFENVPGLAFQDKRAAFRIIKGDFTNLTSKVEKIEEITGNGFTGTPIGYELLFSRVTDASAFGVAQKRQRLVIIGARKDIFNISTKQLELIKKAVDDSLNPKNSLFAKFPLSAIEVFEGRTIPELADTYAEIVTEWKSNFLNYKSRFARWIKEKGKTFSGNILDDYLVSNRIVTLSRAELDKAWREHRRILNELGYYNRPLSEDLDFNDDSNKIPYETKSVKERMENIPPGENYSFVDGTRFKVRGNDISLVYRRLHPLKPSYTILARGGGGTHGYHYLRSRSALTNRERARLQSFPDSFKFSGTLNEQRMQIGEAVPPLLGKAISDVLSDLYEQLSLEIINA